MTTISSVAPQPDVSGVNAQAAEGSEQAESSGRHYVMVLLYQTTEVLERALESQNNFTLQIQREVSAVGEVLGDLDAARNAADENENGVAVLSEETVQELERLGITVTGTTVNGGIEVTIEELESLLDETTQVHTTLSSQATDELVLANNLADRFDSASAAYRNYVDAFREINGAYNQV